MIAYLNGEIDADGINRIPEAMRHHKGRSGQN